MPSAALLRGISMNRRGGFSCPVRTAAILTHLIVPSNCGGAASDAAEHTASHYKQAAKAAMNLTNTQWARCLVSCHSYDSVLDAVARGKLPPVACVKIMKPAKDFVGCVVEFQCPDASATEVRSAALAAFKS
jgi:hypothetical protein